MGLFSDFLHGLLGCGGPETDVELDGDNYKDQIRPDEGGGIQPDWNQNDETAFINYNVNSETYSCNLACDELFKRMINGATVVLTNGEMYLHLTGFTLKKGGVIDLKFGSDGLSITIYPDGTIDDTPVS